MLFCSLGLQAKVTCTTCPVVQPVVAISIKEDGRVLLEVSSSDFSNIGKQILVITITDSRNIEQPAGLSLPFEVNFITCSLNYSLPSNVSYTLRDPTASQTIVTTESDTCLFDVICSLGSSAPSWVTNNGCTFNWGTSDTAALATTSHTIPILITYSKLPIAENFTTSFIITLSCNATYTFPALETTYTIGDPTGSIDLQATNTCGYTVTYSYLGSILSWTSLNDSTVTLYTNDITLEPRLYTVTFEASFSSNPITTLSSDLKINILPC